MQQRDSKVPYTRQGGRFRRRMYEEELRYLEGEIAYLKEIKHGRHEYMIQQRKKRIKEIKEKMKQ